MLWSGRRGEEPGANGSSDHSLIRGLVTALPRFVAGLTLSTRGHRSGRPAHRAFEGYPNGARLFAALARMWGNTVEDQLASGTICPISQINVASSRATA